MYTLVFLITFCFWRVSDGQGSYGRCACMLQYVCKLFSQRLAIYGYSLEYCIDQSLLQPIAINHANHHNHRSHHKINAMPTKLVVGWK